MKQNKPTLRSKYESGEIPQWDAKNPMSEIWWAQLNLMGLYYDAGKLPEWPVDINSREGQSLIRDLIGFLTEEMIEAAEVLPTLTEAGLTNQLDAADELLYKFNEEVADTLHFWIELFIFVDHDVHWLEMYYKHLSEVQAMNPEKGDPFKNAFLYSQAYANRTIQLDRSLSRELKYQPVQIAGSRVSNQILEIYEKNTFAAIKHLQLAKNCLKNKYWTNKDTSVDAELFNSNLLTAWQHWMLSLVVTGARYSGVTLSYLIKNEINKERLKTK